MNNKTFYLLLFFIVISASLCAIELKYDFKTGRSYSYNYKTHGTSKVSYFDKTITNNFQETSNKFTIKCITFQNDAFILDIEHKQSTIRRYLKSNGELKGTPSETGIELPFFITLPTSIEPLVPFKTSKTIRINNLECVANWEVTLKSVNSQTETAIVDFISTIQLPQDATRKKYFKLHGQLFFNLALNQIIKANWSSKYELDFYNKEIAVIRNIWKIENEIWHSIELEQGKK